MNLSKHFIIINDQPKTFQIDFIYKDETLAIKYVSRTLLRFIIIATITSDG